MLRDEFRLLTNRDKYRLKRRRKKFDWRWLREGKKSTGPILEFDTIEQAYHYLLENFASSVEEEVWTIVEDINLETLVSSTLKQGFFDSSIYGW